MRLLLLMLPLGLFAEIINTDYYKVSCKVEHLAIQTFKDGKVETYDSFADGLSKDDTVFIDIKLEEEKSINYPDESFSPEDNIKLHLNSRDTLGNFFISTYFSTYPEGLFKLKENRDGEKFVQYEGDFGKGALFESGKIYWDDSGYSIIIDYSFNIIRYYKDDYQLFLSIDSGEKQTSFYLNCINAKGLSIAIDKFFKYIENQD